MCRIRRAAHVVALPVDVAVWAMGGSICPWRLRWCARPRVDLQPDRRRLVAVLTLSGAVMIFSLRNRPADKTLRLGAVLLAVGVGLILSVHAASLPLFFIATLVAGCGFGAGFLGALRSVVPLALPHERAGLMSAFYVLSYLAFCLPSLLAGNLTRTFGLMATTDAYGVSLIVLALSARVALLLRDCARQGDIEPVMRS
jgi:MFS family permease